MYGLIIASACDPHKIWRNERFYLFVYNNKNIWKFLLIFTNRSLIIGGR